MAEATNSPKYNFLFPGQERPKRDGRWVPRAARGSRKREIPKGTAEQYRRAAWDCLEPANELGNAEFGPRVGQPGGTSRTQRSIPIGRIPSQGMGMLVTRGERQRSGAAGRPAPVRPDVAESDGTDRGRPTGCV